jgi:hypothetical protein
MFPKIRSLKKLKKLGQFLMIFLRLNIHIMEINALLILSLKNIR